MRTLVLVVLLLSTSLPSMADDTPSAPTCNQSDANGFEKLIDDAYKILTTEVASCDPLSEAQVADVIALTLFMLRSSPTGVGIEEIYPAYKRQQAQFDRHVRTLSRSDRKLFYDNLKYFERELAEGSG